MSNPRARSLQGRLSINPDEEPPPPPAPVVVEAPPPAAPEPAAPRAPRRRTPPATPAARPSAVDDPKIVAGRKDYRSFYLEDSVFARFRAAVYWLSRHPEASAEVGENMSAAMEQWMRDTASDLERRYNHGEVFAAPPVKERRKRS